MTVLTVSSKGWVVIPAGLRRKYKLDSGSRLCIVDYGGVLSLVPVYDDPIAETAGILRSGRSLNKALLKQRAVDRAKEKARGR
jgi:AbrB family looped-hinge helix DNA binding protein